MRTTQTILRKRINKTEIKTLINEGYRDCDIIRFLNCSNSQFYKIKKDLIKEGLINV